MGLLICHGSELFVKTFSGFPGGVVSSVKVFEKISPAFIVFVSEIKFNFLLGVIHDSFIKGSYYL